MARCPNGMRKTQPGVCMPYSRPQSDVKRHKCPNGTRKNKQRVCVPYSQTKNDKRLNEKNFNEKMSEKKVLNEKNSMNEKNFNKKNLNGVKKSEKKLSGMYLNENKPKLKTRHAHDAPIRKHSPEIPIEMHVPADDKTQTKLNQYYPVYNVYSTPRPKKPPPSSGTQSLLFRYWNR